MVYFVLGLFGALVGIGIFLLGVLVGGAIMLDKTKKDDAQDGI